MTDSEQLYCCNAGFSHNLQFGDLSSNPTTAFDPLIGFLPDSTASDWLRELVVQGCAALNEMLSISMLL